MTSRYIVAFDLPSERPKEAGVINDTATQWRIVTDNPPWDDDRNEGAAFVMPDMGEGSLEDILEAYMGKSGYVEMSEWTDSPYSYEETISRISKELSSLLHGAALERSARLAGVSRVNVDADVYLTPDNRSIDVILDGTGERERMATPGLGYPVPDVETKNRIIQELLESILEEEGGLGEPEIAEGPKVIIVPTEEVLSEREDVPGSEEGS